MEMARRIGTCMKSGARILTTMNQIRNETANVALKWRHGCMGRTQIKVMGGEGALRLPWLMCFGVGLARKWRRLRQDRLRREFIWFFCRPCHRADGHPPGHALRRLRFPRA